MSTPPNNEKSPRKWLNQKFRSAFSSKRSTSTNVPQMNSPSDGPRIVADRTGSGMKIGFIHDPRVLTHFTRRTIRLEALSVYWLFYFPEYYDEYTYDIIYISVNNERY